MQNNILKYFSVLILIGGTLIFSINYESRDSNVIHPTIITQKALYDTDDPAIWLNHKNLSESLVLGTDKGKDGRLYVYNFKGEIIREKTVYGLNRPNNVDVKQVYLNGQNFAIAAVTERGTNKLRIFSVPDMRPIDAGGIDLFLNEEKRAPMGIAIYRRPSDEAVFAIVSRKSGPSENYLWQYRLELGHDGIMRGQKVREFGNYSGIHEIEAIAVDDELGFVYYSDEKYGVRKYHADPEMGNEELGVFATNGFVNEHEGISIYKLDNKTGYILVSDQQGNRFQIFPREGSSNNPHEHKLIKIVKVAAKDSDGSEVVAADLGPLFPNGLFVAMSTDKTFHFYDWADIAGKDLKIAGGKR